jgi:Fe-S cluster assembly protein SufD
MAVQSNAYISEYQDFDGDFPGQHLPWLNQKRKAALTSFSKQGFPSSTDEEWKYVNFSAVGKKVFLPKLAKANIEIDRNLIKSYQIENCFNLIFLNGRFSEQLSEMTGLPSNIQLCSMDHALQHFPDLISDYFGKTVDGEDHGFIHFNCAWFTDGWFLKLPENTQLGKPIHIIHVSTGSEVLAATRNIMVIGENVRVDLFESYIGLTDDPYLTTAVNEIFIGQNAQVNFCKLQNENEKAFHFSGTYVKQAQQSKFNHDAFSFGGQTSRNEIHTDLGRETECCLNGLYLGRKNQVMDNHTRIHHRMPNAISRETYKGILDQRARGIFQGRVIVHQDAQKTDSEMENKNLLLSEDAEADTKPQLEIYADDVKCAHGVTVGQLDETSIFYLQTRSIDRETAESMLTFAFANEMIEKIQQSHFRALVLEQLLSRFPQMEIRKEWVL